MLKHFSDITKLNRKAEKARVVENLKCNLQKKTDLIGEKGKTFLDSASHNALRMVNSLVTLKLTQHVNNLWSFDK